MFSLNAHWKPFCTHLDAGHWFVCHVPRRVWRWVCCGPCSTVWWVHLHPFMAGSLSSEHWWASGLEEHLSREYQSSSDWLTDWLTIFLLLLLVLFHMKVRKGNRRNHVSLFGSDMGKVLGFCHSNKTGPKFLGYYIQLVVVWGERLDLLHPASWGFRARMVLVRCFMGSQMMWQYKCTRCIAARQDAERF